MGGDSSKTAAQVSPPAPAPGTEEGTAPLDSGPKWESSLLSAGKDLDSSTLGVGKRRDPSPLEPLRETDTPPHDIKKKREPSLSDPESELDTPPLDRGERWGPPLPPGQEEDPWEWGTVGSNTKFNSGLNAIPAFLLQGEEYPDPAESSSTSQTLNESTSLETSREESPSETPGECLLPQTPKDVSPPGLDFGVPQLTTASACGQSGAQDQKLHPQTEVSDFVPVPCAVVPHLGDLGFPLPSAEEEPGNLLKVRCEEALPTSVLDLGSSVAPAGIVAADGPEVCHSLPADLAFSTVPPGVVEDSVVVQKGGCEEVCHSLPADLAASTVPPGVVEDSVVVQKGGCEEVCHSLPADLAASTVPPAVVEDSVVVQKGACEEGSHPYPVDLVFSSAVADVVEGSAEVSNAWSEDALLLPPLDLWFSFVDCIEQPGEVPQDQCEEAPFPHPQNLELSLSPTNAAEVPQGDCQEAPSPHPQNLELSLSPTNAAEVPQGDCQEAPTLLPQSLEVSLSPTNAAEEPQGGCEEAPFPHPQNLELSRSPTNAALVPQGECQEAPSPLSKNLEFSLSPTNAIELSPGDCEEAPSPHHQNLELSLSATNSVEVPKSESKETPSHLRNLEFSSTPTTDGVERAAVILEGVCEEVPSPHPWSLKISPPTDTVDRVQKIPQGGCEEAASRHPLGLGISSSSTDSVEGPVKVRIGGSEEGSCSHPSWEPSDAAGRPVDILQSEQEEKPDPCPLDLGFSLVPVYAAEASKDDHGQAAHLRPLDLGFPLVPAGFVDPFVVPKDWCKEVPRLPPLVLCLSSPSAEEPACAPGSPCRRSSDSEEAFETPESTTPVKAPPPPPPSPPLPQEIFPEEEIVTITPRIQLLSEDTGLGSTSDTVSFTDVSHADSVDESPFRPPSRSFSSTFDEDKPIAASGTYNLDFNAIEVVDPFADSPLESDPTQREPKVRARRKSTDSVPAPRSTLARSLSLQASDFDGSSYLGSGDAGDISGTASASSTLKRVKKPRPTSLKKKSAVRKSPDILGVIEPPEGGPATEEEIVVPAFSEQAEVPAAGQKFEVPPEETLVPAIEREPLDSADVKPALFPEQGPVSQQSPPSSLIDPSLFSAVEAPITNQGKVQNSPPAIRKAWSPAPEPKALEVTPPDTGGEDLPAVRAQSVRLEFDYSEEQEGGEGQPSRPPPKKLGKKPGAKMPLRKTKAKKVTEKPESTPTQPPLDLDDVPIAKGSYTFDFDKWDDPNFNPFSSSGKMPEPSKVAVLSSSEMRADSPVDVGSPFKASPKIPGSPAKAPAAFEISACTDDGPGGDGDTINKPAKKKKTPLKTDTFRVKKSPKRSALSDPCSQECSPLATPETPPVIPTDDHATDEEKLASSVTNQKWTCMTVELDSDKHGYPEPSDLSSFVNENKFISPVDDLDYGNSFEIEYMEKTGPCSQHEDDITKKSLYLMFDATSESPVKSPPVRFSDSTTPGSGSSFEGTDALLSSGMKISHPGTCLLPGSQDPLTHLSDRAKQREMEHDTPGTLQIKMEMMSPEDPFLSADTLLSRISHQSAASVALDYLEPDLAEKNPQVFAQKLQEELEFAAMRIEALKLARHITLSDVQQQESLAAGEGSLSRTNLYSRSIPLEAGDVRLHPYPQQDLDSALLVAREEIAAKQQEACEWKEKYEKSRREVVEMRKIVAEYEKTIAQMIEDEHREKSVSHHTVQQLVLEKEQALADLNSVEKSLADLFRRYEKMKEVLEGFRKNEEVLKKCAQEYLTRVKKEEQRYNALKIHAEEKLDRANAEIAQVRTKSVQEHAASQASLRKEQLKVDALERTVEQKNKEIEELTKICDELISKMGKS
ncbi:transforming acidic coiled-coil-containing protein 2 isoform X5 [Ambystoma mexicanum]|uniref:transforming acidic coiled-coil-containing protein 2 isoform X5 n=1 Tax=Ambystoma mexicanum TaxID=8296 RepID=UPI0037E892CA